MKLIIKGGKYYVDKNNEDSNKSLIVLIRELLDSKLEDVAMSGQFLSIDESKIPQLADELEVIATEYFEND